jgi:hypothetical protein
MSNLATPRCCSHIKVNGRRCCSPALRNRYQCYFHARITRGVNRRPDMLLDAMSLLESPEAVQYALMQVVDGLLKSTIAPVKARLIISTLRIAARNVKQCRFDSREYIDHQKNATDVPDYAEQAAEEEALSQPAKAAAGAPCLRDLGANVGDNAAPTEANVATIEASAAENHAANDAEEEEDETDERARKFPPQPAASTLIQAPSGTDTLHRT